MVMELGLGSERVSELVSAQGSKLELAMEMAQETGLSSGLVMVMELGAMLVEQSARAKGGALV